MTVIDMELLAPKYTIPEGEVGLLWAMAAAGSGKRVALRLGSREAVKEAVRDLGRLDGEAWGVKRICRAAGSERVEFDSGGMLYLIAPTKHGCRGLKVDYSLAPEETGQRDDRMA
ncbi:hypothetical protein [Rhodococcus sp. 11-3]|uniref:hypothetical protein n=1 Tax=Rhodococcus sp. 11-3 TaxID=2854796 RepID=UPI00203C9778|nr:hypothetical protein [Rhodococcus sp. 11-3]USC17001.1 hypothetical protein KZJ41_09105 [Rhodococcus sp. 11-3]